MVAFLWNRCWAAMFRCCFWGCIVVLRRTSALLLRKWLLCSLQQHGLLPLPVGFWRHLLVTFKRHGLISSKYTRRARHFLDFLRLDRNQCVHHGLRWDYRPWIHLLARSEGLFLREKARLFASLFATLFPFTFASWWSWWLTILD